MTPNLRLDHIVFQYMCLERLNQMARGSFYSIIHLGILAKREVILSLKNISRLSALLSMAEDRTFTSGQFSLTCLFKFYSNFINKQKYGGIYINI